MNRISWNPPIPPKLAQPQPTAPTMLVLDDQQVVAKLQMRWFEELGFNVRYASNMQEALFLAKRYLPHVIVTDIFLSETDDSARDGIEFCAQVKSDFDLFYTPVIAYSASRQRDATVETEAYAAGAHAYFRKPFPQEIFRRYIDNLVADYIDIPQTLRLSPSIRPRLRTLYQSLQLNTELRVAIVSSMRVNHRIHSSLKLLFSNSPVSAEFFDTIEALRDAVESKQTTPDVILIAIPDNGLKVTQVFGEIPCVYCYRDYSDKFGHPQYVAAFSAEPGASLSTRLQLIASGIRNRERLSLLRRELEALSQTAEL